MPHTRDSTSEIVSSLGGWKPPSDGDLEALYELSRKSLDEVTRLTEYQDGKASRILTAIAFLSGLAGGLYGALVSKGMVLPNPVLFALFHGFFFCFASLIVVGAFLVVYAIRPRFNIPKSWAQRSATTAAESPPGSGTPTTPRSFLFALQIVKSDPSEWAKAFQSRTAKDLKAEYVKNHIHESYLIAEKILTKLVPLQWGMFSFLCGIGVLLLWLAVTVVSTAVSTWPKAADTCVSEGKAIVITDADNTLWDTNALYARAQLSLLERVENASRKTATGDRLAFVRRLDQSIAKDHPAGLRYPPELLVTAIRDALITPASQPSSTSAPGHIAAPPDAQLIDAAGEAAQYTNIISEVPELRQGVGVGLQRLHELGIQIVVLTEGGEATALRRLNHHGLLRFIDRVIQVNKTTDVYKSLATRSTSSGVRLFSVGDQLDRDIVFAKNAGYTTIYFPGNFKPDWMPSVVDARPDFEITSFEQLIDIVKRQTVK